VLGICRGLQVANVFYGGTLIPDLPSWGKEGHSKNEDGTDSYHRIRLTGSSLIPGSSVSEYEVNSNHHQAIENTADNLAITAFSLDGVAEAAERNERGSAYLKLVQWHPERMKNQDSMLSRGLLSDFIKASEFFMQQNG
jgi:putative glutamine amidotransferase